MKKLILSISSIVFLALLLIVFIASCKKTSPPPSGTKSFIINATLSAKYKVPCELGYGYDSVISFLNFIPKDSNLTLNSIKVFTKNSTIFPDSFSIIKGFTWLDFKIISNPPKVINGVKMILEPNGTVTCKLTDVVKNIKNSLYSDTIYSRFELGKYNDVVNLTGYTKVETSQKLKIHLPSVNNIGKNPFKLQYDTLGSDSGYMYGEIILTRSTPDSAIQSLQIYSGFSVCSKTYTIGFNDLGDYTISSASSTQGCRGLFNISSLIRNGNTYKIRFNRTLDGALINGMVIKITGFGGCDGKRVITDKSYNY